MATAGELMNYTGNAGLGLGSNADIPVSSGKPLEFVNTVLRDIATQNLQKNILKYKQAIEDRDNLYKALSDGSVKVGDILDQDRETVKNALDGQTGGFKDWLSKGYGNIDGAVGYRKKTQEANDVATQAQARLVFAKEIDKKIAAEEDENIRKAMIAHKEKVLSNFNGDLIPFQETTRFNASALDKLWSPITEKISDKARPFYEGTRTLYNIDNAISKATELMVDPKERRSLEAMYNGFVDMPLPQLQSTVKGLNKEIDRYNAEHGYTDPNDSKFLKPLIATQRKDGKWDLNRSLPELAAIVAMPTKNKYKNEAWEVDKDQLAIAKQKLDERELASIDNYRRGQLAIDRDKVNVEKAKLAKVGVPSDIANSASAYAISLMEKLHSLADANGVISPAQLKRLTADELNYLGMQLQQKTSSRFLQW